jgi:hypothetical protein
MRVIWLCLLALLAYVVSMVVLYPAASVVQQFEPQIRQNAPQLDALQLNGVGGKLYSGHVDEVAYTDELLPLSFQNVRWQIAPSAIPSGGGINFQFDGYGGSGEGTLKRAWNGNVSVSDMSFNANSKEFDSFTMPFASLEGRLSGQIDTLLLEQQLLTKFVGSLLWENAELTLPVRLKLGQVDLDIKPEGQDQHIANVKSRGGEVNADGTVSLTLAGDFNADVLLTPTNTASPDIVNSLSQFARRDAQGRFRWTQKGNINRL